MEISQKVVDNVFIVLIEEDVTHFQSSLSSEIMSKMDGQNYEALLINLSKVKFLDSSGLGVLVSILKKTKKQGIPLGICELNQYVVESLEISGFHDAINIYKSEEDGIVKMKKS